MRALAAVIVLAGCGRFEFGSVADGATDQRDSTSDADLSSLLVGCTLGHAIVSVR